MAMLHRELLIWCLITMQRPAAGSSRCLCLTDLENEYNDLKKSYKKFLKTSVILVNFNASLRLTITCLYHELVVNYICVSKIHVQND